MNGKALGIIETVGYVPAIEAADVAVKAADVTLTGCQCVGSGLVSILMHGEVAAVKASVDAGTSAAERLGVVHSTTVIARTAEGLDEILVEEGKQPKSVTGNSSDSGSGSATAPAAPAAAAEGTATKPAEDLKPSVEKEPVPAPETEKKEETVLPAETSQATPPLDMAVLKTLKVTKLRSLARTQDGFPIVRSKIKFAKKSELLKAFARYTK